MLKILLLSLLFPCFAPLDPTPPPPLQSPQPIVVEQNVKFRLAEGTTSRDRAAGLLDFAVSNEDDGDGTDCGRGPEVIPCGDHTFKFTDVLSGIGSGATPADAIAAATWGLELQIVVDSGVECDCCDDPEKCQLELTYYAEATLVTLTFVPGHINPDGTMVPDTWVATVHYKGWVEFSCTKC